MALAVLRLTLLSWNLIRAPRTAALPGKAAGKVLSKVLKQEVLLFFLDGLLASESLLLVTYECGVGGWGWKEETHLKLSLKKETTHMTELRKHANL